MRAEDIRPGMLIDLEGDEYADPYYKSDDADADANNLFAYEYPVVENVEKENDVVVRIDTNHGSFGFPVDHDIYVDWEGTRRYEKEGKS